MLGSRLIIRFLLMFSLLTVVGCTKHRFEIVLSTSVKSDADALSLDTKLERRALITEDDIVSYDWAKHSITLTAKGRDKMFQNGNEDPKRPSLHGKEFVVMADGQRCYFGFFCSPMVSPTVDCPVILVSRPTEVIDIEIPNDNAPDPRSDARIKKVLAELGKLTNRNVSPPGA